MCQLKNIFFSCMYEMSKISKGAYKRCEIETIDRGQYFWLNRRDLQIESSYIFLTNVIQKKKNTDMN